MLNLFKSKYLYFFSNYSANKQIIILFIINYEILEYMKKELSKNVILSHPFAVTDSPNCYIIAISDVILKLHQLNIHNNAGTFLS